MVLAEQLVILFASLAYSILDTQKLLSTYCDSDKLPLLFAVDVLTEDL
jgi:hypothetical protein